MSKRHLVFACENPITPLPIKRIMNCLKFLANHGAAHNGLYQWTVPQNVPGSSVEYE